MGRACLRPREPLAALLRPGRDLRAAGGRLGSQHDVPLHPVALHRAVLERVRLGAAVPVLRPHADGPGAGSGRHRPDLRTGLGDGDRREFAAHGGSKRCGAVSGSSPVLRGRRAQRLRPLVSRHPLPPATPAGGRGAAADHAIARTGRAAEVLEPLHVRAWLSGSRNTPRRSSSAICADWAARRSPPPDGSSRSGPAFRLAT